MSESIAVRKKDLTIGRRREEIDDWLTTYLRAEYSLPYLPISLSDSLDDWGYGSKERLAFLAGQFNRSSIVSNRFLGARVTPPDLIAKVNQKCLDDVAAFLDDVVFAAGRALHAVTGPELADTISKQAFQLSDPNATLLDQVSHWTACYCVAHHLMRAGTPGNDLAKTLTPVACGFLADAFNDYAKLYWGGATVDSQGLSHDVKPKNFDGLVNYLFGRVKKTSKIRVKRRKKPPAS